jgi:hypothetical protein
MVSIEEKLKRVRATMSKRRAKLVASGLCRDCGLNPIAAARGKRKPTLCENCRKSRRDRAAAHKEDRVNV